MAEIINNVDELIQQTHSIIASNQEKSTDDYLYRPITGDNNDPYLAKVGDQYYMAWMKREEEDKPFTQIVLLNKDQANNIYASRSGVNPSFVGSNEKWVEYTGKPVYVNPELGIDHPEYEKDKDDCSEVFFNVKTGEIVDSSDGFEENGRAYDPYDKEKELPNKSALMSNSLIKDGNVSADDFGKRLRGYQLSNQIREHTEINMIISDPSLVYSAGNISFEVTPAERPSLQQKDDVKVQVPVVTTPDTKESVKENFNTMAKETKLDGLFDTLRKDLDNGERDARIYTDVKQVLRYLKANIRDESLFKVEADRAVGLLRDLGLDNHADVIDKYSKEPIGYDYNIARADLSYIKVNKPVNEVKPNVVNNAEPSHAVTNEEAIAAVQERMKAVMSPEYITGLIQKKFGDKSPTEQDSMARYAIDAVANIKLPEGFKDKITSEVEEAMGGFSQMFDDAMKKSLQHIEGNSKPPPSLSHEFNSPAEIDMDAIMRQQILNTSQRTIDNIKENRPEDLDKVCDKLAEDHPEIKGIDCSPKI